MITVQGLVEHFECARVRFSDDVDIFNDVFEEDQKQEERKEESNEQLEAEAAWQRIINSCDTGGDGAESRVDAIDFETFKRIMQQGLRPQQH